MNVAYDAFILILTELIADARVPFLHSLKQRDTPAFMTTLE